MSQPFAAFLSYVHDDDDDGAITALRTKLAREVRKQLGERFAIFQDREAITWGQEWKKRLQDSIDATTFLIPVITPSFFNSAPCRSEVRRFLARERQLGRSDLILPIYYVTSPILSSPVRCQADEIAQVLADRQYADWRDLRLEPLSAPVVAKSIAVFAGHVVETLNRVRSATVPPKAPALSKPARAAAEVEAIRAARQGIFEIDFSNNTVVLSSGAGVLVASGEGRRSHPRWVECIHHEDRPVYEQAIAEFRRQAGLAFRIEFRAKAADGKYVWLELRATMKGPDGKPAESCLGLLADVTTRKECEVEALDRSLADPLTGLGNRVALIEELECLGPRLQDAILAVVHIDHFFEFRAGLGDGESDAVLIQIAERLQNRLRGFAAVFRTGDGSFAVLIPRPSVAPEGIGTDLLQLVLPAYTFKARSVPVQISVGVALGRDAGDPLALLLNAEMALGRAERSGGNCWRLHSSSADAKTAPVALSAAFERGAIEALYDPVIRLADRTVAGFTTHLRWRDPPSTFASRLDSIPEIAPSDFASCLAAFAVPHVAAALAGWQRYFPLETPLFASLCLSGRQICDPHVCELIKTALADLEAHSLVLELTDGAVSYAGLKRIGALHLAGADFAVARLQDGAQVPAIGDLPVRYTRIDARPLLDGDTAHSDAALVRPVIAAGVETEKDAVRLAALGCEFAQGGLFSAPADCRQAMTFIARHFQAPRKS